MLCHLEKKGGNCSGECKQGFAGFNVRKVKGCQFISVSLLRIVSLQHMLFKKNAQKTNCVRTKSGRHPLISVIRDLHQVKRELLQVKQRTQGPQ